MTRGKQIIEEAKRIIAEAHERGNNDPMVDLAVTLSFSLGARWADKHPHWISVDEELPPLNEDVIVCFGVNQDVAVAIDRRIQKIEDNGFVDWELIVGITHWMPLPSIEHLKKGDKNE